MIKKIAIRNFRTYRTFDLDFSDGMNILVGNNDVGKSTLLQAVHLALTCRIDGKQFVQELSPFHFNQEVAREYLDSLRTDQPGEAPQIIIDLYLEPDADNASLRGSNNLSGEDTTGVRVRAYLNPEYQDEYESCIQEAATMSVVPTEYYTVEWLGFSGNGITYRSIPTTASMIDASAIRLKSGADYYLQNIITNHLEPAQRVELSRAYRTLRQDFTTNPTVESINTNLAGNPGDISRRTLSLGIDLSPQSTWESNLVPHLDDLPFQYVGKGEQSALKILLALNRRLEDSHIVLVEEPENHLSFTSMSMLIDKIASKCAGKQVLLTTHSSYVLNKLGLENLVLLSAGGGIRIPDLTPETYDYFKKLSGYDTLRVVLSKRVILVEGPSDELIVQRAYRDRHSALPMAHGIDVINARGLSFKRFLEIAQALGTEVDVVTDNDGKDPDLVKAHYGEFASDIIRIHTGSDSAYKTLEPQIFAVNGRASLNAVLGTSHSTDTELMDWMIKHKTTSALRIFESGTSITMPSYINDAIS